MRFPLNIRESWHETTSHMSGGVCEEALYSSMPLGQNKGKIHKKYFDKFYFYIVVYLNHINEYS